jgi:hypothetical protein
MFEAWPLKIRNEAQRYWPSGQRSVAAIHWAAIFDGAQRQLAPAGALLITERELVLISDESSPEASSAEEPKESSGGIITFIPRLRLAGFDVSLREGFGVLVLQARAARGGEKLEIIFPSDDEQAVAKAMKQVLLSRGRRDPDY